MNEFAIKARARVVPETAEMLSDPGDDGSMGATSS